MRVLVACEFSGIVRDVNTSLKWEAWSCDLLESECAGNHYQCPVEEVIGLGWDLVIAHPPCTYLCNSGVRWLSGSKGIDKNRHGRMVDGCKLFNTLLGSCDRYGHRLCVENPIPHRYALSLIGSYSQIIQPYQFGHRERKATCLWLRGLPQLKPTKDVSRDMRTLPKSRTDRIHRLPPGPLRQRIRSRTYLGIALAMAKQWSIFLSGKEHGDRGNVV